MPRLKVGTGSIYRRGRLWWMTYTAADGRRVRESTKTRDENEARRKLRSTIGDREKGILIPRADRVTVDELLDAAISSPNQSTRRSLAPANTPRARGGPWPTNNRVGARSSRGMGATPGNRQPTPIVANDRPSNRRNAHTASPG